MTQTVVGDKSWVVPRQLRIEYPGAIYHVMNRGERREMGTWTHVANRLSQNSIQPNNQSDLNLCQK